MLSRAASLAAALALAACGQTTPTTPPVIEDYHAPFVSKWEPGTARPIPRPTVAASGQRIFAACDKWPDDCGSTFTPPAEPTPPGWSRPDVPPFDFTPTLPAPEPEPEPQDEPQPETPAEPETPVEPEPEGEPEKQWGPA